MLELFSRRKTRLLFRRMMWFGLRYAETKSKERDDFGDKTNTFVHGSILQRPLCRHKLL